MIKTLNTYYNVLNNFVVRTPLVSLNALNEIYNSAYPEKEIWKLFSEPHIKEAIYLASPDLFDRLELVQKEMLSSPKEKKKLTLALLKYITRLCSRSTPFGLFAGTTVGEFSDSTSLVLKSKDKHQRHTRLDFEVLSQITQRHRTRHLKDYRP